jgi:hypothetical protein
MPTVRATATQNGETCGKAQQTDSINSDVQATTKIECLITAMGLSQNGNDQYACSKL